MVESPSACAAEPVDVPTDVVGIDPEDERVVPEVLTRLVDTARFTLRVLEINAIYPPLEAVSAMEQIMEVLHRISGHLDLYVGDFSVAGGAAMGRARDLLRQARSELSTARNHLAIDGESPLAVEVIETEPVGV